ncbi:signal transduction histidine kinase, LytS [Hymenobacter roseosalivarius DSM 11622]|uniref:Signal transduction histidine kinase, LytS n=1 Tax=Hymenobacter roseosalivarius DSM 11622 TaxID=645990 RepID=A0A1W1VEK9_9BACT|nr:histidine kinase [Hymenobacter roseosalivarius]SMB91812.1 signal transduction histidine kinase, LytS [Hymenobacter roseosalivarius DSM 11622]
MSFSISRRRLYWTLQVVCWGLFGALGSLIIVLLGQKLTPGMLATQAFMMALYIATTHGLRALIQRGDWLRLSVPRVVLRLLPLNLTLAFLTQCVVCVLMMYGLKVFTPEQFRWSFLLLYTLNMNFVFWLWAGLYFSLHYLDNYKRADIDKWKLAAAVREAEMRTLKAQINPHFMFNGLNNIRALVMEDPLRAREMITHLSDLLRYSIQLNSTEQVTLARELEIVAHYLELEAVQLEERLTYSLNVDPAALDVLIPPMTLQLLVENSIKHGIAPRPAGGQISLSARLDDAHEYLQVTVRNTGHYQPVSGHEGVGLRNARERLQLLFGQKAALTIGNDAAAPDVVTARLQLPLTAQLQPV